VNRWLARIFVALIVASLVPIWVVEFHPLPDLSEHLAAVTVLHHYADPKFDLQRYYQLSLGLEPYWGYYGLLHVLAYPFGVELANRIVMSLYVVAMPVGVLVLARRFGRSPALALLAFPLIWNFNFMSGFLPCAIGIAALPFALVLFDRVCERPTWARGAAAAAAGAAMYFTHLLPWAMYVGAAGLVGLLHEGRSVRRMAARVAAWLPSPLVGIAAIAARSRLASSTSTHMQVRFASVGASITELYENVWSSSIGYEDELLIALLAVSWLALLVTAPARAAPRRLHDYRAEACALLALTLYFALPRSLLQPTYWWGVNVRFAAMFVLFAIVCVRGAITGRRALLLAPAIAAALGFAVDTTVQFVRAARFCAGFSELARVPEDGARVLFLIGQPKKDPRYRFDYAQLYPAFYQMRRGGYMPWNFDLGFPLIYKQRVPAPPWWTPEFRWDTHARYYDYVMSFQTAPPFEGHDRDVKRVADAGKWTLWKLPGPRVDVPPWPPYPPDWAFDVLWRPPLDRYRKPGAQQNQ
jgi:hypothetical protein